MLLKPSNRAKKQSSCEKTEGDELMMSSSSSVLPTVDNKKVINAEIEGKLIISSRLNSCVAFKRSATRKISVRKTFTNFLNR